jgi:hypothetical protein
MKGLLKVLIYPFLYLLGMLIELGKSLPNNPIERGKYQSKSLKKLLHPIFSNLYIYISKLKFIKRKKND